jgi:hypothetical protein
VPDATERQRLPNFQVLHDKDDELRRILKTADIPKQLTFTKNRIESVQAELVSRVATQSRQAPSYVDAIFDIVAERIICDFQNGALRYADGLHAPEVDRLLLRGMQAEFMKNRGLAAAKMPVASVVHRPTVIRLETALDAVGVIDKTARMQLVLEGLMQLNMFAIRQVMGTSHQAVESLSSNLRRRMAPLSAGVPSRFAGAPEVIDFDDEATA